jgi:hypothetical protein
MKRTKQTTWELYAKTIRLRAVEKRALRERLVSYMEYHPVRVPLQREHGEHSIERLVSEPYATVRLSTWQFRLASLFAVCIFVVGIPAYAEYAMPGDILYPMKVRVNEEVRASLTWNSSDRVAWQATRVERRVAEARLLAKEGKLTAEAEANLIDTVREHTLTASREIAVLRSTDAEGAEIAQATLASTLEVQTVVLATDISSTTASSSIGTFASTMGEVTVGVGAHDPSLDGTLSAEKLDALLEAETTRARELLLSVEKAITESERSDIERRLSDIERSVSSARMAYQNGRKEDALKEQRMVFGTIDKLISYMSDIDVRSAVVLDTLIPKLPTKEESVARISSEFESLKKEFNVLTNKAILLKKPATKLKYEQGVARLENLLSAIEAARVDGTDVSRNIAEAKALIADLMLMRDDVTTEPTPEVDPVTSTTSVTGVGTSTIATSTQSATTTP